MGSDMSFGVRQILSFGVHLDATETNPLTRWGKIQPDWHKLVLRNSRERHWVVEQPVPSDKASRANRSSHLSRVSNHDAGNLEARIYSVGIRWACP